LTNGSWAGDKSLKLNGNLTLRNPAQRENMVNESYGCFHQHKESLFVESDRNTTAQFNKALTLVGNG
jgi:hypothetical protein